MLMPNGRMYAQHAKQSYSVCVVLNVLIGRFLLEGGEGDKGESDRQVVLIYPILFGWWWRWHLVLAFFPRCNSGLDVIL